MPNKSDKFERILLDIEEELYALQDDFDGLLSETKPRKRFSELTLYQAYILYRFYSLFSMEEHKKVKKFFNNHYLELEECIPSKFMKDIDWYFKNIKGLV